MEDNQALLDNPQHLEFSQCIKSINDVGTTTYQNICTGSTNTVPWGAADWIGAGFLTLICLVAIVALGYLLVTMMREDL